MGRSYIYQRPGRAAYYLSVFDPRTRASYRESANTTDEQTARQRLAEAERQVTLGIYQPPGERKAKAARDNMSLHTAMAQYLAKMHVDHGRGSYVDTTAYLLFNLLEFCEHVERRGTGYVAPEEMQACRLRRAKWKRTPKAAVPELLAEQPGDVPARMLNEEVLEAYKVHRIGVDDADETTVNNELKAARAFGEWLARKLDLGDNPLAHVGDVKDEDEPAGRVLSIDDYKAFVENSAAGLQEWAVISGLHGLRREEVNHLRPCDVDLKLGVFLIRKHYDEQGRVTWRPKFRERIVPIASLARPYIAALVARGADESGHLVGVHDRRKARDRAVTLSAMQFTPRFHDFRHTTYTWVKAQAVARLNREIALGDIRQIFGHAGGTMDDVYDHREVERLRSVLDLSPLSDAIRAVLEAGPAPRAAKAYRPGNRTRVSRSSDQALLPTSTANAEPAEDTKDDVQGPANAA